MLVKQKPFLISSCSDVSVVDWVNWTVVTEYPSPLAVVGAWTSGRGSDRFCLGMLTQTACVEGQFQRMSPH